MGEAKTCSGPDVPGAGSPRPRRAPVDREPADPAARESRFLFERAGDFSLVAHLGSGDTSEVFLAVNPQSGDKRAVKVLRKMSQPAGRPFSLKRQVQMMRGLRHPGIIEILDSGTLAGGHSYYMMEFMPSGNLSTLLKRGRMPVKETLSMLARVCEAVAFAHAKGVIHRNLKPDNILVGSSGVPVVSGFGMAKALNKAGRASKMGGGLEPSPYLAPEQRCGGRRIDRRTDIFALGAILYEMLAGFPPEHEPVPLEISPCPDGLQRLVARCLAADPEERYPDAGILLSEVKDCLEQIEIRSPRRARPDYGPRALRRPGNADGDRIEKWIRLLRTGTARERLAVVREMAKGIEHWEAKAILKVFPGEEHQVRRYLIRVFGEMRFSPALPLILKELKSSFNRECAMEALGKIAAKESPN